MVPDARNAIGSDVHGTWTSGCATFLARREVQIQLRCLLGDALRTSIVLVARVVMVELGPLGHHATDSLLAFLTFQLRQLDDRARGDFTGLRLFVSEVGERVRGLNAFAKLRVLFGDLRVVLQLALAFGRNEPARSARDGGANAGADVAALQTHAETTQGPRGHGAFATHLVGFFILVFE